MPNLVDHLFFRARLDPAAIAIQGLERQISFEQLARFVRKIAHKLRQSGIKPGQVVITSLPDKYLDWIVTLALFHEAVITCSNHGHSEVDSSFEYDWMITDRKIAHFAAEKTILIDNDWIRDAQSHSPDIESNNYPSAADPVRINLTSGTTGHRKAVALSTEQIIGRAQNSLQSISPYSRFLSMLQLSTALGTNNALLSLLKGGPLYCAPSREAIVQAIDRFSIEGIHGSVMQLANLGNLCARQGMRPKSLKMVIYAGASASPLFIQNVSRYLARDIYNDYGSTETAGISAYKHTGQDSSAVCGHLFPDVEFQTVDENLKPLPPGEEGLIRVRRPFMAHAYYKNSEASAQFFKDGWFYPGDRGHLSREGLLFLTGRESEIINRGGVKIDPAQIDRFMQDFPGVVDAAAFGIRNQLGAEDIAAAIVATEAFDIGALRQAVLDQFGPAKSPDRFIRVEQIPRNHMGKALRQELGRKFG